MKWQYIDKETIEAYKRASLWKEEAYYVSYLEQLTAQPDNKEALEFGRNMVVIRQKYLLDTTFNSDGSVNVRIAPIRRSLWQRIRTLIPTLKALRKGV